MQVNVVWSADQVQDIGTTGPLIVPWWRSTYCSIPMPIGPLNRIIITSSGATSAAPPDGATCNSAVVDDGVMLSPLQPVADAIAPQPTSHRMSRLILNLPLVEVPSP
jgi:hypothetical protein